MFDLHKKACTLQHINFREERHGEESVPAIDLKLAADFDGDVLAQFGAELRTSLYKKNEDGDLADQASDVPTALRFPNMSQPLKFSNEIIGATVTIAYGLGDIVFQICNVDGFRLECKEGGTVRVIFRVQARPTGDQVAKLSTVLGHSIDVTIEPPEAANEQQDAFRKAA